MEVNDKDIVIGEETQLERELRVIEAENEAFSEVINNNVIFTTVEPALDFCRSNSLWPLSFGLACCAIEMMAAGGAKYDISRFGYRGFPYIHHVTRM